MFGFIQKSHFLALCICAGNASAQDSNCVPSDPPASSTFIIKTKSGTTLGTAFPIDPRGIFLTAKHLIYQHDISNLVVENLDNKSFEISQILAHGTYNRADTSKLNVFDDWAILAADVASYEKDFFSFPYDRSNVVDFSTLSAHSHLGSSSVTSTLGRHDSNSSTCTSESVVVATLSGYQKTSSGAPISKDLCAYGVTSRFDASYRGFLGDFSSNLMDLQKLNSLSIQIYERLKEGKMKINFIDSLISDLDDVDLERCVQSSETQCIAKHVDQLRKTLSSLEYVVITPISCISENVLESYLSPQGDDFRTAISSIAQGHKVNELLNYEIKSYSDVKDFASRVQSRTNITSWSWISYLELVNKYLQLPSRELNTKPIERAIHNIGMEIGGVFFKDRVVKLYYDKRDEFYRLQIADLRRREARLKQEAIEQQRIVLSKRLQLERAIRDGHPTLPFSIPRNGPSSDFIHAERELRTAENRLVQLKGETNSLRDKLSSEEEEFAVYSTQKSDVISSMASFEIESLDGLDFSERLAHYELLLEETHTPGLERETSTPLEYRFTSDPDSSDWEDFLIDESLIASDHRILPFPANPQPFDMLIPDGVIVDPNGMGLPFEGGPSPLGHPNAPFQLPNQGSALP